MAGVMSDRKEIPRTQYARSEGRAVGSAAKMGAADDGESELTLQHEEERSVVTIAPGTSRKSGIIPLGWHIQDWFRFSVRSR